MAFKQDRNDQLLDALRADVQFRYEPNFAWKSACSAFLALPAVRAVWSCGNFDALGNVHDLTGQGRTLAYNGNPTYNYDGLAPYIDLDGTGDYLSRPDEPGLDILGNEAYVAVAARGLTMGGWFWFDGTGAVNNMMGKWAAAGQTSYYLQRRAVNDIQFCIWDGVGAFTVNSTVTIAANNWYFVAGRFDPSTAVEVYVNGTWTANVAGIPAAILNSTATFTVGVLATLANYMDGRVSMCFLCAADLSDAQVFSVFEQTRAMYGV